MKRKKKIKENLLDHLSNCQLITKDNIYNLVHSLNQLKKMKNEEKSEKKIREILLKLAKIDEQLTEVMTNYIEDNLPH